jgi:peptidoglycan/xylan/chitin deacetylase (PgdA/CDA1 family)
LNVLFHSGFKAFAFCSFRSAKGQYVSMPVSITVDLEQDCPPFLSSFRGIEQGLPLLLDLFRTEGISATFFATGEIGRKFPGAMRALVAAGHELGCHGDSHRRFSTMTRREAAEELNAAAGTLRAFYPVISFRAPHFDLPDSYLPLLRAAGFRFDSSLARYKRRSLWHGVHEEAGVVRIPASTMPSIVRLPRLLRRSALAMLRQPSVLFFHPWEFVDMTNERIPYDCRFGTGAHALHSLYDAIAFFRERDVVFSALKDLPHDFPLAAQEQWGGEEAPVGIPT